MTTIVDPATVKACCTSLYEHRLTGWLLEDGFHPGGVALTDRLVELLEVSAEQQVVDVAAGPGTSALRVAATMDARVHGVDLSSALVEAATERARNQGLSDRVVFTVGDAERLPLGDGAADVVLCECSLCIFPDKRDAVREMARVVRPGGRVGVADVVVDRRRLPPELDTLAARVACIADARTLEENIGLLQGGGLRIDVIERHDAAVMAMLDRIDARLAIARMALPAERTDDIRRARSIVSSVRRVVEDGVVGYALVVATRADGDRVA